MSYSKIASNPEQYYDAQASAYDACRSTFYYYFERYSVLAMLPDLNGKNVLDAACGSGLYTRELVSLGAGSVTGVDLSAGMLALAKAKEAPGSSNIRYIHSDICDWVPDRRYDLAFSAYLLNYAQDHTTLESMVHKLAESLTSNGRLIVVLGILGYRRASEYNQTVKDFCIFHEHSLRPYEAHRLVINNSKPEEQAVEIYPYHIDISELWQILADSGFSDIQMQAPSFSPEAAKHTAVSEIACLTAYPPVTLLSAIRR